MNDSSQTVGIVGYGEVGKMIAGQFQEYGFETVVTNRDPTSLKERLDSRGPAVADSVQSLGKECDIVISCVWPNTAQSVAKKMETALTGTYFVDLNSISPLTTRKIDQIVTGAGGTFLKGTVMDSIAVLGSNAPILLAGPDVDTNQKILTQADLVVETFGSDIERPAALKMCRSMVTKGIMVLFMETLITARNFDLEEEVLETVHETFTDMSPAEFARYFLVDMADNSQRRHAEMEEVLETAQDKHIDAPMTKQTHHIHEFVGNNPPEINEYTDMLDAVAAEFQNSSSEQ